MLISVIIPVYNVESYLKECLDSVSKQTYGDFEVILINDGSTDSSLQICKQFEEQDKRFKVIDKKNEGVSIARNAGIEKASGEWISFVDSDDKINEDYLSQLFIEVEKGIDLVFQGVKRIDRNSGSLISKTNFTREKVNVSEVEKIAVKHEITLNGNPVAKLFKRDIIVKNGLRFNEKFTYNEDKLFIMDYIAHSKGDILFSDIINYHYFIHKGSLTNRLLEPEEYLKPYRHFKFILKEQFKIDYQKSEYSILFVNFKIYLHMYINSAFILKKGEEQKYLDELTEEDWKIYKRVSKISSKGRKIFDFFLLRNYMTLSRIIIKYTLAKHFK